MKLILTVTNSFGKFVGEVMTDDDKPKTKQELFEAVAFISENLSSLKYVRVLASDGSMYLHSRSILNESILNFKIVEDEAANT